MKNEVMVSVFMSDGTNNAELANILRREMFLDSFVGYTNRLYQKTHKKISSIGQLTKAYNAFCVSDFNKNRTYDSLKSYPSISEAVQYVIELEHAA